MRSPLPPIVAALALACLAVGSSACSGLTRPDDITITAEPIAPKPLPAPPAAMPQDGAAQAGKPAAAAAGGG